MSHYRMLALYGYSVPLLGFLTMLTLLTHLLCKSVDQSTFSVSSDVFSRANSECAQVRTSMLFIHRRRRFGVNASYGLYRYEARTPGVYNFTGSSPILTHIRLYSHRAESYSLVKKRALD